MIAIKFCGLTSLEDCFQALEAGANWLGFNFYPHSPRRVTEQACRAMVDGLRSRPGATPDAVKLVGVFVNAPVESVLHTLDSCALDLAQLSGDEPPEASAAFGGRAYLALRAGPDGALLDQAQRLPQWKRVLSVAYAQETARFPLALVDAPSAGQYGGAGRLADWQQARRLAEIAPIFLAGGLTSDNVADAVRFVRPWGVDAASGIESAPGKKDPGRMRAFVDAVRGAEAAPGTGAPAFIEKPG